VNWLEPLIDSSELVVSSYRVPTDDPRAGLALLLEGRLPDYQRLAERVGWPPIGEPAAHRAPPSQRLLAAVGLQFAADERAEAEYLRVMRARDPSLVTASTVLLSLLYSDSGEGEKAIRLLQRRLRADREPIQAMFLHLHLGTRHGERGEWAAASAEMQAVQSVGRRATPASWRHLLGTIAHYNDFVFMHRQGSYVQLPPTAARAARIPLTRSDVLLSGGLSDYLDKTFDAALADPYTRSVRFQATDPAESALEGALLRSECLAYWSDVKRSRKLLGRYLVISKLETPAAMSPAALELLRRAGDASGLQAAARALSRRGPLNVLQQAGDALVARWEFGDEPATALILLRETADLLKEDQAAQALSQLMAEPRLMSALWNESARTLAALTKVAPSLSQTEVALNLRSRLSEETNPALVQELARVVAVLRWEEVEPKERAMWLSLIEENLTAPADIRFVAEQALLSLASVEQKAIEQFLDVRLREELTLALLALSLQSLGRLPASAEKDAWPLVSEALARVRGEAARGSYGFGGLDLAGVAVGVLQQWPKQERWQELIDFLIDPKVAVDAKTRTLDLINHFRPRIPAVERRRLRDSLPEMTGFADYLQTPEAFEGAKLRLGAHLSAFRKDELLTRLLDLAGTQSAVARIQAARTLANAQRRIGEDVATTIASTLARDPDPEVRAAAARALPQLGVDAQGSKRPEREDRLMRLLDEPGRVVPLGAVAGLIEAGRAGFPIDALLRERVERLERHHPSYEVRRAAAMLIEELARLR
jgi:hypothetical protein